MEAGELLPQAEFNPLIPIIEGSGRLCSLHNLKWDLILHEGRAGIYLWLLLIDFHWLYHARSTARRWGWGKGGWGVNAIQFNHMAYVDWMQSLMNIFNFDLEISLLEDNSLSITILWIHIQPALGQMPVSRAWPAKVTHVIWGEGNQSGAWWEFELT